jgi:hypothetical protein
VPDGGLDRRRADLGRDLEAGADVPLPLAREGRIDGQQQGLVPGLGRLLDHRSGHAAVAKAIDLHPALAPWRRLGDLGRAGAGQARKAHHRPGGVGRAGHPLLTVRMGEQLEGDRRDQEGDVKLGTENRRLGRDVRDVDQDPGPQLPSLVGLGIAPQGPLVACAAGEIAVRARLELLERETLEVRDVDRIGHAPRLFAGRTAPNDGTVADDPATE